MALEEYSSKKDRLVFSAWGGVPFTEEYPSKPLKKPAIFQPHSIDHHFKPFKAVVPLNEEPYVKARERHLKRGEYVEADNIDQQHRDFLKQQYSQKPKWVPRTLPRSQEQDTQGEA